MWLHLILVETNLRRLGEDIARDRDMTLVAPDHSVLVDPVLWDMHTAIFIMNVGPQFSPPAIPTIHPFYLKSKFCLWCKNTPFDDYP